MFSAYFNACFFSCHFINVKLMALILADLRYAYKSGMHLLHLQNTIRLSMLMQFLRQHSHYQETHVQ